ncbi:MAG: hypothetical protein KKF30_03435 [Proteobacteria bacterium]|nr:hypothetical protein [Pseudomonadota bacterium]MBU4471159.1 hypothetical protein [Pseudomonadota bacterium]MCG2751832.1 hypothetical protein [Desulfobacteraceae bacterium]
MKTESTSLTEVVKAFLVGHPEFFLSDLTENSGIERVRLLRVLEKFRKEGYLEIIKELKIRPQKKEVGPYRRDPRYRVIKDISSRIFKRPEYAWQKVWRTLRHLRRATRSDVERLTGCPGKTVEYYTFQLAKRGYLKAAGRRGREKVWFLVKDVGPKPPNFSEVFDGK